MVNAHDLKQYHLLCHWSNPEERTAVMSRRCIAMGNFIIVTTMKKNKSQYSSIQLLISWHGYTAHTAAHFLLVEILV